MSLTIKDVGVGIVADDTTQQHIIRSALLALGFQIRVAKSPDQLEDKWLESKEIDLWIIDLIEQNAWDDFVDTMIERSEATLMFSDGNAPPTYSGKYPRWQKRLLVKISSILKLDVHDIPVNVVQARAAEIKAGMGSGDIDESLIPELKPMLPENTPLHGSLAQQVWVLAASLGGPAAVKLFLDSLKPGLPVAFILVQHIDDGFQNLLGQVLGRNNEFEFIQEFTEVMLKPGQVLITPADYAIRLDVTRHIVTTQREWKGPYSPSINEVMHVVAENYGKRCGAIVFSGMGNDGIESAEYMSSVGGTIWAQTADSCANSSQPDEMRKTGFVTYNGSPQQLAAKFMNTLAADNLI